MAEHGAEDTDENDADRADRRNAAERVRDGHGDRRSDRFRQDRGGDFGVAPSHRAMAPPLIMAVRLPMKHTAIIDFQRARIWCSCSYSGKASATTAGCSRSLRILLP